METFKVPAATEGGELLHRRGDEDAPAAPSRQQLTPRWMRSCTIYRVAPAVIGAAGAFLRERNNVIMINMNFKPAAPSIVLQAAKAVCALRVFGASESDLHPLLIVPVGELNFWVHIQFHTDFVDGFEQRELIQQNTRIIAIPVNDGIRSSRYHGYPERYAVDRNRQFSLRAE
jgi:hypothetical protein